MPIYDTWMTCTLVVGCGWLVAEDVVLERTIIQSPADPSPPVEVGDFFFSSDCLVLGPNPFPRWGGVRAIGKNTIKVTRHRATHPASNVQQHPRVVDGQTSASSPNPMTI